MKKNTRLTIMDASGVELDVAGKVARSITFESLEEHVRLHAQEFIQSVLEHEVRALLGRERSERKEIDALPGYRNGHGKSPKRT